MIYEISHDIKENFSLANKNIASQTENWPEDIFLSYYLKSRYFGKVKQNVTNEELKEKLIKYKIQYYIVHGKLKNQISNLKFEKKFGDISIYKVVGPKDALSDKTTIKS